jgi:hypothetical protein
VAVARWCFGGGGLDSAAVFLFNGGIDGGGEITSSLLVLLTIFVLCVGWCFVVVEMIMVYVIWCLWCLIVGVVV